MRSLLESYYSQDGQVKTHLIEGLGQDVNRFRRVGLRNLVRKIAEIIRQSGGAQGVAINATGGYKAQIALAAIIGQTLDVAVYYKHESFAEVIALPPMPVGFNFDLFGMEADLLLALEEEDLIPIELEISEEIAPLLEEIEQDGTRYASLSAMGQLFLEGYRLRYPPEKHLPAPAPPQEKKDPSFRDDHYPKGFKEYVTKVWQESPYIKTCHSNPYDGQKGIKDRTFRIDRHNGEIVGEYRDSSMGGRFAILTSAQTQAQKLAVISDLSMRYKE